MHGCHDDAPGIVYIFLTIMLNEIKISVPLVASKTEIFAECLYAIVYAACGICICRCLLLALFDCEILPEIVVDYKYFVDWRNLRICHSDRIG